MTLHRTPLALLLLIGFGHALAAAPAPDLPPDEVVARVLRGNPGVQAAGAALKTVTTLNIALAALLLGLAFLRTRSLALPIGIHWAWNFVQGNLLGFPVSGTGERLAPLKPVLKDRPDWLTGGAVGLEGSLACTAICLAATLLLFFWRGSAPQAPDRTEA